MTLTVLLSVLPRQKVQMPKRSSGIFVLIVVSCEKESFLFPFLIPISLTKKKNLPIPIRVFKVLFIYEKASLPCTYASLSRHRLFGYHNVLLNKKYNYDRRKIWLKILLRFLFLLITFKRFDSFQFSLY